MTGIYRIALFAAVASSAACSVHGDKAPPLSGPSEFALSLTVTATPDSIAQDGASQASIAVHARDVNAKAVAGVVFRMQTEVLGVIQDVGTLSTRSIVTGTDGKATAVYTAPAPPRSSGDDPLIVTIRVTPTGSNYQATQTQTAAIRLTPPGVVLPPTSAYPTANFTGPTDFVEVGKSADFDASASCAAQVPCADATGIASYSWDFGDGGFSSGQKTSHTFLSPGRFVVTLKVLNDVRLTASASKTVTVTIAKPTAAFVISPTDPAPGDEISFNASGSTVALGHTLTQFIWDFGKGQGDTPGTSFMRLPNGYSLGKYTVTLTVIDDTGQKATVSKELDVKPRTTTK